MYTISFIIYYFTPQPVAQVVGKTLHWLRCYYLYFVGMLRHSTHVKDSDFYLIVAYLLHAIKLQQSKPLYFIDSLIY